MHIDLLFFDRSRKHVFFVVISTIGAKTRNMLGEKTVVALYKFNCICLYFLQSHSSVERAGLIASVKMRALPTDEEHALRGQTLQEVISRDRAQGLIPIFVSAASDFDKFTIDSFLSQLMERFKK